jgi:plastocyanin
LGGELRMRAGARAAAFGALWLATAGAATAQAGVAEVRLRDASGAPVAEAVVSLHPADGSAPPRARAAEASMDQRNKQFAPHVLAVQQGSAVRFPNSDQIRHHVYSFSEAKRFELRLYHGVPAEPVLFDRAGTVVLGCNIHDDMLGFVRVVDTPWFATSDASGLARIEKLPAGRYRAEFWHARLPSGEAPAEQPLVELAEGAPAQLEVTLVLGPEPEPPRPRRLLRDRLREDRGP